MRKEFPTNDNKHMVAIGIDEVIGPFIIVWKLDDRFSAKDFRNQPDTANVVFEEDNTNEAVIISKAVEYGVNDIDSYSRVMSDIFHTTNL